MPSTNLTPPQPSDRLVSTPRCARRCHAAAAAAAADNDTNDASPNPADGGDAAPADAQPNDAAAPPALPPPADPPGPPVPLYEVGDSIIYFGDDGNMQGTICAVDGGIDTGDLPMYDIQPDESP